MKRAKIEYKGMAKLSAEKDYIGELLSEVLNNSISHDLTVKVGASKWEFQCHRLVLAASSDFLCSVLKDQATPVLIVPDIEKDVFGQILVYMYTGSVQVHTFEQKVFTEACKLLGLKEPTAVKMEETIEEIIEIVPPPKRLRPVEKPKSIPVKKTGPAIQQKTRKSILNGGCGTELRQLMNSLESTVKSVFQKFEIKHEHKVKVELRSDGLKGWFDCMICSKGIEVSSVYERGANDELIFEGWLDTNILKHLEEQHNFRI